MQVNDRAISWRNFTNSSNENKNSSESGLVKNILTPDTISNGDVHKGNELISYKHLILTIKILLGY